jgi:hypothetical protein
MPLEQFDENVPSLKCLSSIMRFWTGKVDLQLGGRTGQNARCLRKELGHRS